MLALFVIISLTFSTYFVYGRPCEQTGSKSKLTLPWGTWEGTHYDEDKEITVFKNVRFGKAPIGDLRFAAPQYPDAIKDSSEVQDSSYGPSCIQAAIKINEEVSPEPATNSSVKHSEDCLFLDIYAPSWVLEEDFDDTIPVIVWIYGGAYIFGGKDAVIDKDAGQAYDGQGILEATNMECDLGSTMEAGAQPNAGLYDQRLILDFVQKYIGLVRGDKDAVSVWGLSAGAGSILHHLTAFGGKDEPPKFRTAALFSTAFQWAYDRKQTLQETFLNFTSAASCPRDASKALSCLRKLGADDRKLNDANQQIVTERLALGLFPFGPAVDGKLVPDLPANLLAQGKYTKEISSMILSHDWDEASLFLAKWVDTKEQFTQFLSLAFPGNSLSAVRSKIEEKYPSKAFDFNQTLRMRQVLRDSTFVCNKYQLYKAYKDTSEVYAIRYELPPATHGSDLLAIIYNRRFDLSKVLKSFLPKVPEWLLQFLENVFNPMAQKYQLYLAGFGLYGNPNYLNPRGEEWSIAHDDGDEITNSFRIGLFSLSLFSTGQDQQTSATACDFWNEIAKEISLVTAIDEAAESRKSHVTVQDFEL